MDTFMKRSAISGKRYDYFSKDLVRILNFAQIQFFCDEKGILPVDVVFTEDRQNPGKKMIMFIFSKEDTREAYVEWKNRNHKEDSDAE